MKHFVGTILGLVLSWICLVKKFHICKVFFVGWRSRRRGGIAVTNGRYEGSEVGADFDISHAGTECAVIFRLG